MSVVLCLPAHLCVSPQRPVAGPPRERVKSVSPPRGYPALACHSGHQPRAARRSSSQLAACSAAQQLAAQRSGSQRRPATAPSSSRSPQRRPEHPPDRAATVKEVHRPGLLHQRVPSADQQGRVNHLHNHRLTSTSRTPNPVLMKLKWPQIFGVSLSLELGKAVTDLKPCTQCGHWPMLGMSIPCASKYRFRPESGPHQQNIALQDRQSSFMYSVCCTLFHAT